MVHIKKKKKKRKDKRRENCVIFMASRSTFGFIDFLISRQYIFVFLKL